MPFMSAMICPGIIVRIIFIMSGYGNCGRRGGMYAVPIIFFGLSEVVVRGSPHRNRL